MRAERKVNESADTCRVNRSCIHSRSICCNGGSEAQREKLSVLSRTKSSSLRISKPLTHYVKRQIQLLSAAVVSLDS